MQSSDQGRVNSIKELCENSRLPDQNLYISLQACLTSCHNAVQYKVKDMTQADFGRLEIELAEAEMPGLIACRSACTRMPVTCSIQRYDKHAVLHISSCPHTLA